MALLAVTPAAAQEAFEIDIDEIEYCLREAGFKGPEHRRVCIGFVAEACQADDATGGPGSTADCLLRESAAWTVVATRRHDAIKERAKPDIAAAVGNAQEGWAGYRTSQCEATGVFFYQYSGSASAQWQARCMLDLAAERALLLDDWLMRLEDF